MSDNLTLGHGSSVCTVSPVGAELLSWRIAGRELIWGGDAAFWPRRAPVLFPVCGWMNGGVMRAKGRVMPCGVHGFGPDALFHLERTGADSLRATLADNAATRAAFPYRFGLSIDIALEATGFRYDFAVSNPGDEPLPYALGFHPGYVWPFDGGAKQDYRLEFQAEEVAHAPRIAPGGLFTGETLPVPFEGRDLNVLRGLDRPDALVLLNARSRWLRFVAPSGRALRVEMAGIPHWVFWSRPGGDYLCIEGWTGHGDPVGFTGEIIDKPGQTLLAPGESARYAYACRFE